MRKPRPPRSSEWTLADGAHDVLRFLMRRAPWALVMWWSITAALTAFSNLGAAAGPLSAFMILVAFISIPSGIVVGMTLSMGLLKAVRFVGWVPTLMAGGAAVLVIALGAVTLGLILPYQEPFFAALVPVMASIGAIAAVLRFTWADA